MNRSKIFLTASSFVLAIAGVAATKATSNILTGYYYQTSATTNNCVYVGVQTGCDPTLSIQCTTFGGKNMYKTITATNKVKCLTALKHS